MNLIVQYRFDSIEDFLAEYASDLSLGGIFIRTADLREVGAHVYLQFVLKDGRRLIEGLGRVVRVVSEGPQPGLGVAFVNLDPDSKARIASLVGEGDEPELAPD